MSRFFFQRRNQRTERGSLAIVMPAAILLGVVALGMLAMDITHNITVRSELQSATDAAALAGAQDLVTSQMSSQSYNAAVQDALAVGQQNTADGRPVSNTSQNTTVTAQAMPDLLPNQATVQVDAQMTISNMFAKLVNHPSDPVTVQSKALASGSITGAWGNQLFPLAVSIDTTKGHTQPVYQNQIGDTITFDINSQQYKNAAFTSFTIHPASAEYIKNAIDQMLGLAPMVPGYVPAVNIGDSLYLNNGVDGQKRLADGAPYTALTNGAVLYLPVMQGDPPYNQTRQCVGFVAVKVTDVQKNQSGGLVEKITVKLIKGLMKGTPGLITSTNNSSLNSGLQSLSAGTVQLSQ